MCKSFKNTKILDKRFLCQDQIVRRRRECYKCKERFTTYELRVNLRRGGAAQYKFETLLTKFTELINATIGD